MALDPVDLTVPRITGLRLEAKQHIPIVAPTVAAFIGRTERGPLNEPVSIASVEDYRRTFGGHCAFSYMATAVQHFFQHGGQSAYVVRVANRATRASIDVPAGDEVLRLQARQPGSREYLRVSIDYDRVEHEPARFNLIVQRVSRPGSQLVDDQEYFQRLSVDAGDERYVARALEDSELVRLAGPVPGRRPDATRAHRPGDPIPYLDLSQPGTDGEELTDYDIIGSNREGTGLFALDRCERFDLLCIPQPPGRDLGSTSFVAAERYCEMRRALLIWDPPWSWESADAAVIGARNTVQSSHNVVTYFPRVRPRGEPVARYAGGIPACGAVAGILARSDRSGVWQPLAGADSLLRANLAPLVEVTPKQAAMLRRFGVNTFVRAEAGNYALHGNVTQCGPNAISRLWRTLDRRRLALFVLNAIEQHTQWAQGATDEDTAAELERQVWIFLSRLHQQGALAGCIAEQAFFARAQLEARAGGERELVLRIGFAPHAANELVGYELRYRDGGIVTHQLPALEAEQYAS